MPIYEFICRGCGARFEKLTSYDWKVAGVCCPECGSRELDQAVSLVGAFKSEGSVQSLDKSSACTTCGTDVCSTCR